MSESSVIDPERYPRAAGYLAALPDGLDSHPEFLAKASLFRSLVEFRPLPELDAGNLPPRLLDLLSNPPPVSKWIPEAHSHAALAVVLDLHCHSSAAVRRMVYEASRSLFGGPMYGIAMRLIGPRRLLRTAARRWHNFHRGATLELYDVEAHSARVRVAFAPHLYDETSALGLAASLQGVLDVAGAQRSEVDVESLEPEAAVLLTRY